MYPTYPTTKQGWACVRQVDQVNKYSLTGLYDTALKRVRSLRPFQAMHALMPVSHLPRRLMFVQASLKKYAPTHTYPISCLSFSFTSVAQVRVEKPHFHTDYVLGVVIGKSAKAPL